MMEMLHVPGKTVGERLDAAAGRRLAVVLIDLQNDYCLPAGVFAKAGFVLDEVDKLVASANALAAAARAGGHPVLWVRMVWDDQHGPGLLAARSPFLASDGLRRGTWGADPLAELDVQPQDAIIEKTRFGAFHETRPDALLAETGTEALVVGGVRTDFCVESTVREAFFRDLEVFVVREACAGYVPLLHDHSLRLMGTVFACVCSLGDAVGLLDGPRGRPAAAHEESVTR